MKVIAVYFLVDILLRPRFLNRREQNDEKQFELELDDDGDDDVCCGDEDDGFCRFELGLLLLLMFVVV